MVGTGENKALLSMLHQTKSLANVAAIIALVGVLASAWQFVMSPVFQEMFTLKELVSLATIHILTTVGIALLISIDASRFRITNKLKVIRFNNAGWLAVSVLFLLLSLGVFGPCEVGEFAILTMLQVIVLGRSLAINSHDLDQLVHPECEAVGL